MQTGVAAVVVVVVVLPVASAGGGGGRMQFLQFAILQLTQAEVLGSKYWPAVEQLITQLPVLGSGMYY